MDLVEYNGDSNMITKMSGVMSKAKAPITKQVGAKSRSEEAKRKARGQIKKRERAEGLRKVFGKIVQAKVRNIGH